MKIFLQSLMFLFPLAFLLIGLRLVISSFMILKAGTSLEIYLITQATISLILITVNLYLLFKSAWRLFVCKSLNKMQLVWLFVLPMLSVFGLIGVILLFSYTYKYSWI